MDKPPDRVAVMRERLRLDAKHTGSTAHRKAIYRMAGMSEDPESWLFMR
jgi:hypothetical protein